MECSWRPAARPIDTACRSRDTVTQLDSWSHGKQRTPTIRRCMHACMPSHAGIQLTARGNRMQYRSSSGWQHGRPARVLQETNIDMVSTWSRFGLWSSSLEINKFLRSQQRTLPKAPFRCPQNPKNFAQYPSHRILRHMHGVLNVDEKKLITQLAEKS